jgi:hypothetical protein
VRATGDQDDLAIGDVVAAIVAATAAGTS